MRSLRSGNPSLAEAIYYCHSRESGNPIVDPRLKRSGMTLRVRLLRPFGPRNDDDVYQPSGMTKGSGCGLLE